MSVTESWWSPDVHFEPHAVTLMILGYSAHQITEECTKDLSHFRDESANLEGKKKKKSMLPAPRLSGSLLYNGNELTVGLHLSLMRKCFCTAGSCTCCGKHSCKCHYAAAENTINRGHQCVSLSHTVHLRASEHQAQSEPSTQSLSNIRLVRAYTWTQFPWGASAHHSPSPPPIIWPIKGSRARLLHYLVKVGQDTDTNSL